MELEDGLVADGWFERQRAVRCADEVASSAERVERVRPDSLASSGPYHRDLTNRVDPKTVTRWARTGKLTAIRTLGGHRRFRAEEVARLRAGTADVAQIV